MLVGGDLGAQVQTFFSGPGDEDADSDNGLLSGINTPLYYGPGNGEDEVLESEAVPIDSGTVSQLWVQTSNVPGAGEHYSFNLCINNNCKTPVTCSIILPTLTECSDLVHTQDFARGDTIALQGTGSTPLPYIGANPTHVTWSVVVTRTAPHL